MEAKVIGAINHISCFICSIGLCRLVLCFISDLDLPFTSDSN